MAEGAVTADELRTFYDNEQRRLALQRQAKDLESCNAKTKERLLQHVRNKGGSDRTTVLHGFVLAIVTRAGSPAYKEAYLALAGVDAAEALRKKAEPVESLKIEQAA